MIQRGCVLNSPVVWLVVKTVSHEVCLAWWKICTYMALLDETVKPLVVQVKVY